MQEKIKDDMISRQEAINALSTPHGILYPIRTIEKLPSAQSERKTGKWTHGREIAREMIGDCTTAIFYEGWTCSECSCLVEKEREPWYKYCPNCGADMRGDRNE